MKLIGSKTVEGLPEVKVVDWDKFTVFPLPGFPGRYGVAFITTDNETLSFAMRREYLEEFRDMINKNLG